LNKWKCNFLSGPEHNKNGINTGKKKEKRWHESLGLASCQTLRFHDHVKLAHYADAAVDIEFEFPCG
jgi:glycyl-tRNA synthetase